MVKAMLLLRIDKSRISGLKFKNDIVSSVRRISPVSDTDTQQQARPLQGRNTPLGRFVTGKRGHFGKKVSVL